MFDELELQIEIGIGQCHRLPSVAVVFELRVEFRVVSRGVAAENARRNAERNNAQTNSNFVPRP